MQARAAAFAREQVIPAIDGWERDGRYPRAVVAASGLTGLFCPAAVGGAALSYPEGMAVFEELGRGDAALAFSLSMHNAVAAAVAGHAELAERWAEPLAAGEALGGFSLTEPHAGSDATAITTRAEPDGDGWRVTGRKAWVSLAGEADLFLVVCKTSADLGHRDIAIVAVDAAAAGVSFPVLYRKACAEFLPIGEMELYALRARSWRPPAPGCGRPWGDRRRPLRYRGDRRRPSCRGARDGGRYASERQAFGAPLLDLDPLRFALADVATDWRRAGSSIARPPSGWGRADRPVAVAHAKRFCPDAALRAAIACSEVLGATAGCSTTPWRG